MWLFVSTRSRRLWGTNNTSVLISMLAASESEPRSERMRFCTPTAASAPPLPHIPPGRQQSHQPRRSRLRRPCGTARPRLAPQLHRSLTANLLTDPRTRSQLGRMCLRGNATTAWFIQRIPNHPTACVFPAISLPFPCHLLGITPAPDFSRSTDKSPTFHRHFPETLPFNPKVQGSNP